MAEEIKYQINVQITENTIADGLNNKIFAVVPNGTADQDRIVAEMAAVNPGLEPETIRMVMNLENRVTKRLLLSGMRVNNGLFEAYPQCRGVANGTAWDPNVNSLYVNFNQGKDLREAIAAANVNVIGPKGDTMYFSTGSCAEQRVSTFFEGSAGLPFTLTGRNIKIAGDDPSVGISFTDSEGKVTRVANNLIAINMPSSLVFVIPAELANGTYTLTVTTQFSSSRLRKTPQSVSQEFVIIPVGSGGDSDSPDEV